MVLLCYYNVDLIGEWWQASWGSDALYACQMWTPRSIHLLEMVAKKED